MNDVLVTTFPFAAVDKRPIRLLEKAGLSVTYNPFGRKITEEELVGLIADHKVLIAGTEAITERVIKSSRDLKLISRVGIGLDSVDLVAARKHGVRVTYTPDAPSKAVSELTIGLMINLIRSIHLASSALQKGLWKRHFGYRLENLKIGLIGVGRIGQLVLRHLSGFGVSEVYLNDLEIIQLKDDIPRPVWVSKEDIFRSCDIISIHVPLTKATHNLITTKELGLMKRNSVLLNTSRGGIVNEADLAQALENEKIGAAAVDVFELEPYCGPLTKLDNCILTSHMGSMTYDCRAKMEIEATLDALRWFDKKPLENEVE